MDVIYGVHSVAEALKARARNFDHVEIAKERSDPKMQRIIDDCRASGIPVRFVPREALDRLARTANHQGVVAVTTSKQYSQADDLIKHCRGLIAGYKCPKRVEVVGQLPRLPSGKISKVALREQFVKPSGG